MKKIDPTVKKETKYIAVFCIILSMLMQSVFLIIQKWDYTVLLGNLFGYAVAVGNFFLMAYNVQLSLEKNPDDAKKQIKLSQSSRFLLMLILAVVAYLVPFLNIYSALIPYLFPRIAVAFHPIFNKE